MLDSQHTTESHAASQETVSIPEPTPLRICIDCERSLSDKEFPSKDSKTCRRCFGEMAEYSGKAAVSDRVRGHFAELVDRVQSASNASPTFDDICIAINREIGGPQQFAHLLMNEIMVATREHPGRASTIKALLEIGKLFRWNDQGKHEKELERLSDEQLRTEKQVAMAQMLSDLATEEEQKTMLRMLCIQQGIDPGELLPQVKTIDEISAESEESDGKEH